MRIYVDPNTFKIESTVEWIDNTLIEGCYMIVPAAESYNYVLMHLEFGSLIRIVHSDTMK